MAGEGGGQKRTGGSCFGCLVWLMSFVVLFLFFFGIKACVFDKHAQPEGANFETTSSSTMDSSSVR